MSLSNITILDIAKFNGSDAVAGLIDETIRNTPELTGVTLAGQKVPMVGTSRTIKGIGYKTLVRTSLPTVSFRGGNQGTALGRSTWENRYYEAMLLTPPIEIDEEVANLDEDGPAACMAKEASGIWSASVQTVCRQFYYGATSALSQGANDSMGFPGLAQVLDTTNMQVDATGTAATTGSSVWAVRYGLQDVSWIFGLQGEMRLTDPQRVRVTDGAGNPYMALHQEIVCRVGLQVGRSWSMGRIKNLTADAGKGLTDKLLGQLASCFKVGYPPHAFFMSRRSLEQLRESRTAVNITGAPAPTPVEFEGIPILPTESILNTEVIA
jgi:hypothetical protein